jgi:hypothetical protein
VKQIPGYEKYAVDKNGDVWRIGAPRGIPLRPGLRNGYSFVVLSQNAVKKACSVHHLVLRTFVGPAPAGMEPRHLNGNNSDNRLVNLKWGTKAENTADNRRLGVQPIGEACKQAKLTEAAVRDIRRRVRDTHEELAKEYGVSRHTIEAVRYGRNWKHVVR